MTESVCRTIVMTM